MSEPSLHCSDTPEGSKQKKRRKYSTRNKNFHEAGDGVAFLQPQKHLDHQKSHERRRRSKIIGETGIGVLLKRRLGDCLVSWHPGTKECRLSCRPRRKQTGIFHGSSAQISARLEDLVAHARPARPRAFRPRPDRVSAPRQIMNNLYVDLGKNEFECTMHLPDDFRRGGADFLALGSCSEYEDSTAKRFDASMLCCLDSAAGDSYYDGEVCGVSCAWEPPHGGNEYDGDADNNGGSTGKRVRASLLCCHTDSRALGSCVALKLPHGGDDGDAAAPSTRASAGSTLKGARKGGGNGDSQLSVCGASGARELPHHSCISTAKHSPVSCGADTPWNSEADYESDSSYGSDGTAKHSNVSCGAAARRSRRRAEHGGMVKSSASYCAVLSQFVEVNCPQAAARRILSDDAIRATSSTTTPQAGLGVDGGSTNLATTTADGTETAKRSNAERCDGTGTGQSPKCAKRIGEAAHPGPPMSAAERASVQHAARIMAHTGRAPADLRERDPNTLATFSLRVTTANGTGWGPLKQFLASCADDVVCAQEHHLIAKKLSSAKRWCAKNGWQAFWGPADPTAAEQGSSGGTAVFVRISIGAVPASTLIASDSRVCAAYVDIPGGERTLRIGATILAPVAHRGTCMSA